MPGAAQPFYGAIAFECERPALRQCERELCRVCEIPFVIDSLPVPRIPAKVTHQHGDGCGKPACGLKLDDGAEDESVGVFLIQRSFQLCDDAESGAVSLPGYQNSDELCADFRQAQLVERVCLLNGLRLIDSLLLEFDADAHLQNARKSHLELDRVALANDFVLVELDAICVACDPARRLAPRPRVLALELETSRRALQVLELELSDEWRCRSRRTNKR